MLVVARCHFSPLPKVKWYLCGWLISKVAAIRHRVICLEIIFGSASRENGTLQLCNKTSSSVYSDKFKLLEVKLSKFVQVSWKIPGFCYTFTCMISTTRNAKWVSGDKRYIKFSGKMRSRRFTHNTVSALWCGYGKSNITGQTSPVLNIAVKSPKFIDIFRPWNQRFLIIRRGMVGNSTGSACANSDG